MTLLDNGFTRFPKDCFKLFAVNLEHLCLAFSCGQFHKTFFGVIYAPSGVTSVKTQGNMPIAA
jgi:hypothetical protein